MTADSNSGKLDMGPHSLRRDENKIDNSIETNDTRVTSTDSPVLVDYTTFINFSLITKLSNSGVR